MERSTLVRRGAPVAVFAAVLGALGVLALNRDGSPAATGRLDPLPLAAGGGGARDANTAEARSAPGAATTDMAYWGPVVIPDRLLAGQPTEGPAHRVTPGDTSEGRIAGLARALGVIGTVRSDSEGWVVGEGDRVLRVYRQPGTPWHLGPDKGRVVAEPVPASAEPQPAPDEPTCSDDCDKPVEQPADDPARASDAPASTEPCDEKCSDPGCMPPADGTEPACVSPPEPTKPPQPTDAEARATAQRVFDAVGLTEAKITLNDAWSGKEVVAAPVVGGLPTIGFETRVTVELGGRVQYAYGHLAGTESKGDYPLLAPRDAVERSGYYGQPRTMEAYAPCEAPPCPSPKPREARTLRLGLVFMTSHDAEQGAFLAPAWLLSFEGSDWEEPFLALPDRYLAPPPADGGKDAPPPPDSGSTSGGGSGGSTGSTGAPDK